MGGECSAYTRFWWGNLRKSDHLKGAGIDGKIILNGFSGNGMWGRWLDRAGSG